MLLVVVVLNVAFLLDRSFLTYARVYFCVFLLSFLYVITLTYTYYSTGKI